MHVARALSLASIVVGTLLYLAAVAGLLFDAATPPTDVGLVATCAVFVLGGLAGLALKPRAA